MQYLEREIGILENLNHKNIVKIYSYGTDGVVKVDDGHDFTNLIYIIMEYLEGGTLFDLVDLEIGMSESNARYIFSQILDALEYMQSYNVCHRDLKIENIMIDENWKVTIVDFGVATQQNRKKKLTSYCGTTNYMAPEILERKEYEGKQVDMFSAGVVLFTITVGLLPFTEARQNEKFYKLLQYQPREYWAKVNGSHLSLEFKDLFQRMTYYNPEVRPTVKQLKANPWMNMDLSLREGCQTCTHH